MAKKNEFEPPLTEGVRKCMKSNKSKNTSPELKVRKALRDAGYPGYRLNWKKAPGKPDICYPGRKIAIFINGCFWHRCPKCNLPPPKHNADYWIPKLNHNVERDNRNYRELGKEGWTVVVIWGCDINRNFETVMYELIETIESKNLKNKDEGEDPLNSKHD